MPITVDEYLYPFDPTGTALTNKIADEVHVITQINYRDYYFIIPKLAPFFSDSVSINYTDSNGNIIPLVEGQDYYYSHHFLAASRSIGKQVYGSISVINRGLRGTMFVTYQTLGGMWTYNEEYLNELMSNIVSNPRISSWDSIVDLPATFPVIDHEWDLVDMVGMNDVVVALSAIADTIADPQAGGAGSGIAGIVSAHLDDHLNPHSVTKQQVGLGNVENLPLATTSEAQTGALNSRYMTPLRVKEAIIALISNAFDSHLLDHNNPHVVTKTHVGLGNVPNYGVATNAEAIAGVSNTTLITPALAKAILVAAVGAGVPEHIADHNNPHATTAAQVGTLTTEEINTLLLSKLSTTGTAANASKFDNKTVAEITTLILAGKAAAASNSDYLGGKSLNELLLMISTGSVTNATKLENNTLAQIYDGVSANSLVAKQFKYNSVAPGLTTGSLWMHLFSITGIDLNANEEAQPSCSVIINGFKTINSMTGSDTYIVSANGAGTIEVRNIGNSQPNIIFGRKFVDTVNGGITTREVQIWVMVNDYILSSTATELSNNKATFPVITVIDKSGILLPTNVYKVDPTNIDPLTISDTANNSTLLAGKTLSQVVDLAKFVIVNESLNSQKFGNMLPAMFAMKSDLDAANTRITALESQMDQMVTDMNAAFAALGI